MEHRSQKSSTPHISEKTLTLCRTEFFGRIRLAAAMKLCWPLRVGAASPYVPEVLQMSLTDGKKRFDWCKRVVKGLDMCLSEASLSELGC